MKTTLKIGDRVRYRAEFLRSIMQYTGPLPAARGTITALTPLGSQMVIASITWDNDHFREVPGTRLTLSAKPQTGFKWTLKVAANSTK